MCGVDKMKADGVTLTEGSLIRQAGASEQDSFPGEPEDGITFLTAEEYVTKTPIEVHLDWDTCETPFVVPDINCNGPEWTQDEEVGAEFDKINVNTGEVVEVIYQGACW